jgi:protein CpxP
MRAKHRQPKMSSPNTGNIQGEIIMSPVRKSIIIGLTVLGMASASVFAQTPAPAEGRHGHAVSQEQRQAKWGAHLAKRQAKLHDALKLTAAQEPAWNAFIATHQPQARMQRGDHAMFRQMPAPQRMEKNIEMAKQRMAMMESRLGALKTFYAVLSPEQQKLFDENSVRRGHRGHGMRHG